VHGMDPKILLARTFRERAAGVSHAYARAVLGEEEAVHALRVAVRRMRVVLGLLAAHPRGKQARRADERLRALAAAAGSSRDLDVGRPHLARLRRAARPRDPAWASLLSSYRGARRREREHDAEALLDCELARLRRALRQMELAEPGEVRLRLDVHVRTKGARLVRDVGALTPGTDQESVHRIRRGIRRLRYAAELAAKLPDGPGSVHRGWRLAQNALGEIQDRRALAAWLDGWAREKLPRRRPASRAAARRAAATLRAEADALQAELAGGSVAAGVAEAIEAMSPQREVGGGVPFPKVHPAITLISG